MESLIELRRLITRHASEGYERTALDGVSVFASYGLTESRLSVSEPTLAIVAQGAKRAVLNDRMFDYGAGQYLVITVALPFSGHVISATPEEPFLAVGLTLKPAVIASLLLEMPSRARGTGEPPGIAVHEATEDILEPVVRLLRLLDRPDDIPVLGPAAEREIMWRLLTGERGAGAMLRGIGLADSRLSQISRAVRWIRGHYDEVLRVEELARTLGMSASSFHRHFRAITTMSPVQYQKRIRLQEARIRLMAGPQDVAAVGFAVGYDSPSQFSREYRRQFGAPPSQDAARLQRTSGGREPAAP